MDKKNASAHLLSLNKTSVEIPRLYGKFTANYKTKSQSGGALHRNWTQPCLRAIQKDGNTETSIREYAETNVSHH